MKDKHGYTKGLPPYIPIKGKLILECNSGWCEPVRMAVWSKSYSYLDCCQECKEKDENETSR